MPPKPEGAADPAKAAEEDDPEGESDAKDADDEDAAVAAASTVMTPLGDEKSVEFTVDEDEAPLGVLEEAARCMKAAETAHFYVPLDALPEADRAAAAAASAASDASGVGRVAVRVTMSSFENPKCVI